LTSNGSQDSTPQNVGSKRKRGAPPGNRNRYKNGLYTKDAKALRKQIAAWKRATRALLAQAEKELPSPSPPGAGWSRGRAEEARFTTQDCIPAIAGGLAFTLS
jgi:hypothetical protein